eukprot:CAMPEP_0114676850 /NCGR_PEP_ID=MMETSP0191-20121206/49777_1 /TAXON_ID=126664 /ORGANISM="Sorites sp." /LENGTH=60 /DNA_ID=CAMNT_0001948519 /DNA_START=1 /DNA_END=183 /DNA_ORIENTATION=-
MHLLLSSCNLIVSDKISLVDFALEANPCISAFTVAQSVGCTSRRKLGICLDRSDRRAKLK